MAFVRVGSRRTLTFLKPDVRTTLPHRLKKWVQWWTAEVSRGTTSFNKNNVIASHPWKFLKMLNWFCLPWREVRLVRAFKRTLRANGSWSLQLPLNMFSKHFLKKKSSHLSSVPPTSVLNKKTTELTENTTHHQCGAGWKSHSSPIEFLALWFNEEFKSAPFRVFWEYSLIVHSSCKLRTRLNLRFSPTNQSYRFS